jgi:Predicted membrane protein (DUF2339)
MTAPQQAALKRLAEEFTAMSDQMARVAGQFTELQRVLVPPVPPVMQTSPVPPPVYLPPPPVPVYQVGPPPPGYLPPPPPIVRPAKPSLAARLGGEGEQSWIGKLLAVAGVAVTLIGVVLLLVLAAQAGILRPEIRVGAGALLAAGLVAIGVRMNGRPGGRVGAIALAATGIAAGYMDVIAITTIYHWTAPVFGLILASAIGGAGLMLARRWDSQHLGLLVLVPLIVLAPIVADGVTLLLIGFMIVLSAAALPVQLGKDWIWMHAARTAAVTLPLLVALLAASFSSRLGSDDPWLLGGASAVAALLAVTGALILLPRTSNGVAMALLTVVGVLPALSVGIAVDRVLAALLSAAVAASMLAIVMLARRLPGVSGVVGSIWSALSAVAALIAITVTFEGHVEGPVLLGLALTVIVAGRRSRVTRWTALGFAALGGALYLAYAPPDIVLRATTVAAPIAISTLAASVLAAACAIAIAKVWTGVRAFDDNNTRMIWAGAAVVIVYAVTVLTVTTGVLVGGDDGGFLAGHMAATICWIAMAAGLFILALRVGDPEARTAPIAGGLALTAAAMAKLFLFDLGTLDGMFRVAVFIVVGLVLLGMGTGYARSLAQQDRIRST